MHFIKAVINDRFETVRFGTDYVNGREPGGGRCIKFTVSSTVDALVIYQKLALVTGVLCVSMGFTCSDEIAASKLDLAKRAKAKLTEGEFEALKSQIARKKI